MIYCCPQGHFYEDTIQRRDCPHKTLVIIWCIRILVILTGLSVAVFGLALVLGVER